MRHFAIALLFCVVSASAAICSVEVVQVLPSSQNPLITVLKDGTPQQGAKLTVAAQNAKHKQLTLTTDSHGVAMLPRVPAGTYCVVASASPTLRANLCFRIGPGRDLSPSAFTMQLAAMPALPPTPKEVLAAAQGAPVSATIGAFSGTVVDLSGAAIRGVSIMVYRQRPDGARHPHKFLSDAQGRFSARLTAGRYFAAFSAPGFATQFLTFELAPSAEVQELNVKLNFGAATEAVAVKTEGSNR